MSFVKNYTNIPTVDPRFVQNTKPKQEVSTNSFREIFEKASKSPAPSTKDVIISKHASKRFESRNISLNAEQLQKVSTAIDKADKKGIKDALIVLEDYLLIASVKNKTIITSATKNDLNQELITNIDGAIIL